MNSRISKYQWHDLFMVYTYANTQIFAIHQSECPTNSNDGEPSGITIDPKKKCTHKHWAH